MLLSVTFPLDMELKPCHFSDDNNSSSDRLSVEVKGDFNDDLSDSGQVDSEDEEANIEYGDYATIYRAVIRDADGTSTNVVLKCSHKNTQSDLIQEAVFYLNQLKPLQGIVVPKFYGLFHGIGPDDLEIVCILLEDCGKSVAVHFKELSLRDRCVAL
ncbi:hypothetical protein SCP_1203300 [Sparassis crispa]|uniref:Protein kinase domain-containing protein n=1 Tax=Sparassis crispa TaxID=139825 RepID=A0A401H101_9APHY|nr:hypothetical protein SCP_1203300 [Sparassis crispa]GBE88101.1 hypothetical protein SCP_1203300 [Sparassis crispa]